MSIAKYEEKLSQEDEKTGRKSSLGHQEFRKFFAFQVTDMFNFNNKFPGFVGS